MTSPASKSHVSPLPSPSEMIFPPYRDKSIFTSGSFSPLTWPFLLLCYFSIFPFPFLFLPFSFSFSFHVFSPFYFFPRMMSADFVLPPPIYTLLLARHNSFKIRVCLFLKSARKINHLLAKFSYLNEEKPVTFQDR